VHSNLPKDTANVSTATAQKKQQTTNKASFINIKSTLQFRIADPYSHIHDTKNRYSIVEMEKHLPIHVRQKWNLAPYPSIASWYTKSLFQKALHRNRSHLSGNTGLEHPYLSIRQSTYADTVH
jgi:hypothetical protein